MKRTIQKLMAMSVAAFAATLLAAVMSVVGTLHAAVPAGTDAAYSEMTIPVIETRSCDFDEGVITIDTVRDPGFTMTVY